MLRKFFNWARSLVQPAESNQPVPRAVVLKWGTDFNALLSHKIGTKALLVFLKAEMSEENLLLWQAVEQLKQETKEEKMILEAYRIFNEYIKDLSPHEVSFDYEMKNDLYQRIKNPTSDMYNQAQEHVRVLMQRDSYPKFLNSSIYRHLVQTGEVPLVQTGVVPRF